MIEYNIGIIGAGNIAGTIADTLKSMNGFDAYAVASRDIEKAQSFAAEHNIEKAYGSYEELLQDEDVELIYIATVNSNHAELARKCLDAGKPCFIEKPFSYNRKTAEELLNYAESKGLFCGEAMWLRFNPLMRLTVEQLKSGIIGDVRNIVASLGYNIIKKERLLKPELAGGALLDIGIYPLTAVMMILGPKPDQIIGVPVLTKTGVDAFEVLELIYPQGRTANLTISATAKLANSCTVYGTHGRIEIDNINNPTKVTVYGVDGDSKGELTPSNKEYNGYEYEFKAARTAALNDRLDTKECTKDDILNLYRITDDIRRIWKVKFPLPEEDQSNNPEND